MATGRNELCPCGSGRKYKSCCIEKDQRRGTPRSILFILMAIAGIGLAVAIAERNGDDERTPAAPLPGQSQAQNARPSTPQPQPPGPAPAGKVWSAEHGHWHDAPGAQPTKENPITINRRNIPQPPGPAPAGKVWSPEHGHWHTKKK